MSLESDGSDAEALPTFTFLKQQLPAAAGDRRRQPPPAAGTVVICSSDSEGSPPPSPGGRKVPGRQRGGRASSRQGVSARLSSASEEEEITPLSERLRGKLVNCKSSKTSLSLSECQQLGRRDAARQARGPVLPQHNEQVVTEYRDQALPKAFDIQRRTPASSWEMADSDPDDATRDSKRLPSHRPPVCLSDSPVQSSRSLVAEAGSEMASPQKKSKRSQEERKREAGQAALQRRRELEVQKGQQEQERERKKALANIVKAQRPVECLKHITVVLDPVLLQVEGGGQILSALQSMDCCCVIESQAVPCSITWRRRAVSSQVEESSWIEEPNILVLLRLEDFISMIYSYKQEVHGGTAGSKETLRSFVACVLERAPGKTLALAVVELEKYFRSHKGQSRKKLRQAVLNGSRAEGPRKQKKRKEKKDSGPELSRVEVEEALVDLQLHTGVQLRLLESWKELGDFASMFTKAVAEAPFKLEREKTGFSFYLESEWCGGVKVDRSGKGLSQVWKRQIQQFNRVSLEMASAIVSAYPSPLLLSQEAGILISQKNNHSARIQNYPDEQTALKMMKCIKFMLRSLFCQRALYVHIFLKYVQ
ncbi:crossover junction endonuclease EME1 isoform X2 [Emydura macquarii macquarii]|uniref:crossover junction endonuclease EME1 isoform X2 n=1 Tax=Emydura macquarii macquarii TaxID=1129001 RepID=UPI00352AA0EC